MGREVVVEQFVVGPQLLLNVKPVKVLPGAVDLGFQHETISGLD